MKGINEKYAKLGQRGSEWVPDVIIHANLGDDRCRDF